MSTVNNSINYPVGVANGIAQLDSNGHVPDAQLSANLASLSGLSTLGIPAHTATTAFAVRQFASSDNSILITNGDLVLGDGDLALNRNKVYSSPITISSNSYVLLSSSVNVTLKNTNNSSDTTITIPQNASVPIPIGAQVKIVNGSTAGYSFNVIANMGVTINPFTTISVGPAGYVLLEKTDTDTWNILALYEEYTHSTSWSGIWASPEPGNIQVIRNMHVMTLTVPSVLYSQTTSSDLRSTVALPARFYPPFNTEMMGPSVNNNGNTTGSGTIFTTGIIRFCGDNAYGNFSGTGTGGFNRQTILYTLL